VDQYRVVWVNKGTWKKPGPIAYMGLLNAMSFAWNGQKTDFFINADDDVDIQTDLDHYYGLSDDPLLSIREVKKKGSIRRRVYQEALESIAQYCSDGENVLVLTREVGILPALIKLKRKFSNLKVLHEVHDYYGSIRHLPKRRFSDYRRMISEHWSFGGLDGLICLTEYQRALYQQWFPKLPMVALPLGGAKRGENTAIDFEDRRKKRRVAYIGHLHDYKGLHLIFRLAEYLKNKEIEIVCYGGHDKQVSQLIQQAESQGVGDTLKFVSFISPAKLNDVLCNEISLGLVPLQDTYYSRYLTCPVKALEFMASGLPIVGSDMPSVRDVVADLGLNVESTDEKAYGDQICHLLDDSPWYAKVSKAEVNRSKEISWEARASQIMQFVSSMPTAVH
jgi:glycosyltransferase involved in cell wall biosynthesis